MLLYEVFALMKSLLNTDLQKAIILLKNKNINYAYNEADAISNDMCGWNYTILSRKRHNKYKNSYIYLAVIETTIVECKLYQANKEHIYVVTTLSTFKRNDLWLTDAGDVII